MKKTLDTVKPSEGGVISTISGEGALFRRLLDMGLTPGAPVQVIKAAPLGDPIEITVRGYHLSIRKADARCITLDLKTAAA